MKLFKKKSDQNQEFWNLLDQNQEFFSFLVAIQKKSDQNQDWNIFFENIIYDNEYLGSDQKQEFWNLLDQNQEFFSFLEAIQKKSDQNQEFWNLLDETIQKKSDQNQDWNIFFENIIYDNEYLGLDTRSIVPEIKNKINIDLTEEEYLDSIKGIRFENIASKDDINAAKAEILKAIEEIAKEEHVELKNKTKEELANLSVILLKKIGEGI